MIDLNNLRRLASEFWRWWVGELIAAFPVSPAAMFRPRTPSADILISSNETVVERVESGAGERHVDHRNLLDLDDEAWSELMGLADGAAVRLLLGPPDVYSTTLPLPRKAERRAREIVALQIDDIAPIPPAMLRWNFQIIDRAADRITVRVAMAKVAQIEALRAAWETHGLASPPVYARLDGGTLLLDLADEGRRAHFRRTPLAILALVASIPLTIVCISTLLIWSNQSAVEALQKPAAIRLRLEHQNRVATTARAALADLTRDGAASRDLDDLAGRLPLDASLFAISSDGTGRLRAAIDATAPETVREALASDPVRHFSEIDETPQEDGRMRVVYETRAR